MFLYAICAVLHLLAAFVWLGHMVFWSVVVGPVVKRLEPPEAAAALRRACSVQRGMGWPALAVLFATGAVLLHHRGCFTASGFEALRGSAAGLALGLKIVLVAGMAAYQALIGHRPAPRMIYLNMLVAFLILAISVLIVRNPDLALPLAPE